MLKPSTLPEEEEMLFKPEFVIITLTALNLNSLFLPNAPHPDKLYMTSFWHHESEQTLRFPKSKITKTTNSYTPYNPILIKTSTNKIK